MKSWIYAFIALFIGIIPHTLFSQPEKNFPIFSCDIDFSSLCNIFGINADATGAIKSLDSSINQNIKRLFVAATGLALVTTGCLVIKEQISKFLESHHPAAAIPLTPIQPFERPKYSFRDGITTASGTLLILAGFAAILLCDKFAQIFTSHQPHCINVASVKVK